MKRMQSTLDLFVKRNKIVEHEADADNDGNHNEINDRSEARAVNADNKDDKVENVVLQSKVCKDSISVISDESGIKLKTQNRLHAEINDDREDASDTSTTATTTSSVSASPETDTCIGSYGNDIGKYINMSSISSIDDRIKCELLERHWKPPQDYEMPFSTHHKKREDEKRYLHHSQLNNSTVPG